MTLTLDSTLGVTLSGSLTANVAPFPQIIGDGSGQEIVLTANSSAANSVGGVTVVSSGSGFTTASLNVLQQGTGAGAGAVVTPIIPPKGGHGYDPVTELGGYFIMVNSKLTQDESGSFTTTNDFRKIGLLTDPNQDGSFSKVHINHCNTSKNIYLYVKYSRTKWRYNNNSRKCRSKWCNCIHC